MNDPATVHTTPRHRRHARLRAAAIRFDLMAARWRYEITGDNTELRDLLPEQIEQILHGWPPESPQHQQLQRRLAFLRSQPPQEPSRG